MPSMAVSQFCCGCSLRTGAIAIGYFYAIIGFGTSVIATVALGIFINMPPEKLGLDLSIPVAIFPGMALAFALVQTAVSVCLIFGSMEEKVSCLSPWIIYAVINAVLAKLSVISLIVVREPGDNSGLILMAVQAVQAVLYIYCLLVVCSYRTQLLRRKEDHVLLVEPHKFVLP